MIDRLNETLRCCGMEITVEKNYGNENIEATVRHSDYGRSETNGKCGVFQIFFVAR
jgi:hypothetical protein